MSINIDATPIKNDKRVKLTRSDKEDIVKLHDNNWSIRQIARLYEVDKRTIQFILFPERLERNKALRRERLLCDPQRYYDREKHTRATADLRNRKKQENKEYFEKECPICHKIFWGSQRKIYCCNICLWTAGNRRKSCQKNKGAKQ